MAEAAPAGKGFFGHPRGLFYLAFTEVWERFSYYGMTALLALYMGEQLLKPGHAEHVLGLAALRHLFEFRGPIGDQAFASLIFGWYTGLVYFTPVLGGFIADRLLGAKRAVVLGALLMTAGHLAMAFDESFVLALALLILGSGFLKGNIAAQVGQLYPAEAESMRAQGFTIFSAAINIGSVIGPLACGVLAETYGWHAGFGCAAGFMVLALLIYLAGQRHLPDGRRRRGRATQEKLNPAERKRVGLLVLLIALTVLPGVCYTMIWNIGLIWIDEHASLATPLGGVPVSWFNSVDSFFSVIAAPPIVALWRWQAKRGREPGDVAKIGIGSALTGASALFMSVGALMPGPDGRTPVYWPLACFAGMGIAFLYYWPVLLALVSQKAPRRIEATMISCTYFALFGAGLLMGWVGSFYAGMDPAAFWALDAAFGLAGGLIVLLFGRMIERALAREPSCAPDGPPDA